MEPMRDYSSDIDGNEDEENSNFLIQINSFVKEYSGLFQAISFFVGLSITILYRIIPTWLFYCGLVLFLWSGFKLLIVLWSKYKIRYKPPFPKGLIFKGVFTQKKDSNYLKKLEDKSVIFDRSNEIEELKTVIENHSNFNRIIAITGVSGVGKSVVVNKFLDDLRNDEKCNYVQFENFNYSDKSFDEIIVGLNSFVNKHEPNISESNSDEPCKIYLILDQFETCLDYVIENYLGEDTSIKSLRNFIKKSQNSEDKVLNEIRNLLKIQSNYKELTIIVVIRSDRYYDLRMLGKHGQIPFDAFEVLGISKNGGTTTLLDAIKELGANHETAKKIIDDLKEDDGTILPVKAQIIGCILEFKMFYTGSNILTGSTKRLEEPRGNLTYKDYKKWGSSEGLIETYFRRVIESSPNPEIARELLYVMSIEGRIKTRYWLSDLSSIVFRSEKDIKPTIDHLVRGGIVSKILSRYALVHDYIANEYKQLSGRLLQPVVRDNLSYSHTTFLEGKKDTSVSSPSREISRTALIWLLSIQVFIYLFFAFRLFGFDSFPTTLAYDTLNLNLPIYKTSDVWILDWHYLPISLVQMSWAFYVIGIVKNIFLKIDRNSFMTAQSISLIVVVLMGMIWTAFLPSFWLIWVGVVGVVVGMKFYFLGSEVYEYIKIKTRFQILGFYTIINCILLIYIGWFYYLNMEWDLSNVQTGMNNLVSSFVTLVPNIDFITIYYAIIPLLIYFIYMYKAHAKQEHAVEFIGLYNRIEAIENN